ncbi:hypothetical protein [Ruegeria sp. R14_0]|uniref:hypothetical protein n=1 Tax=Ruegeria sp. R14_0 TaxID=2821100 RepID=UPI001ADD1C11|nr:hypothetical protein [Ruegeria sp. R14_0]MBO9448208.1 hypothetical protein [Ruegeria sp. R14_0]
MSKHSTATKVETLAQEAAQLPTNGDTSLSDEVTDLLTRLATENDTMKAEVRAMKKNVEKTMKMGQEELKSEIAHHPMQSVATAFAIGFIASLLVRRT